MRDILEMARRFEQLGLTKDEAIIFAQLLDSPKTQLEVSRATGIARSSVYRIVDVLMAKGLIASHTTDNGKLLAVARPDALELLVVEQEHLAQERRKQFDRILPLLASFQGSSEDFAIRTYVGTKGIKQMLWNELQAKTEILLFSGDRLDLATGRRWAEKFRLEVIERNLKTRGIENRTNDAPLSAHPDYSEHYIARYIDGDLLSIQLEISTYDDKVCIYNSLAHDSHLGTEVTNPFLASFMRQVFEHYWSIAQP